MKTLALALGLASALPLHDFFISILTIRHSPATKTLDLTWRMTAHDIEHSMEPVALLKLGSEKEHPKADSLLNAYFIEHLHLSLNSKPLKWIWVGKELESENLYCYLQVDGIEDPEGLTVENTLLQDLFYEQQNIVHLETGGHTLTHTFIRDTPPFTFNAK